MQADVFEYFKPNISAAVKGYNYVLIACGTKGTGKSFSLIGPPKWERKQTSDLLGVIPRSFIEVFS